MALGWLLALVVCVIATLSEGHRGDLGAMTRWMTQLQSGGYSSVQSNYPPFLLNWRWLGGKIFEGLSVGPPSTNLVKSSIVLLVWCSWMLLRDHRSRSLVRRSQDHWYVDHWYGVTPAPSTAQNIAQPGFHHNS